MRKSVLTLVVLVLLAILGAWGWHVLPEVLRGQVERVASEKLHRRVTVGAVGLQLSPIEFGLRDVRVMEPDGKTAFASVAELTVRLSASSVWRLTPIIDRVRVHAPMLHVVRREDASLSIADVLQALASTPPSPEPARFVLRDLVVDAGSLSLDDRVAGVRHAVTELDLRLPALSSLPEAAGETVKPALHARLQGTPVTVRAQALPYAKPLRAEVEVETRGLDLAPYLRYLPAGLPVTLQPGRLDAALRVALRLPEGKSAEVDLSGKLGVATLAIRDAAAHPLLSAGAVTLTLNRVGWRDAALDAEGLEARIAQASLPPRGPALPLVLSADAIKLTAGRVERDAGGALRVAGIALDGNLRIEDRDRSRARRTEVRDLHASVDAWSSAGDAASAVALRAGVNDKGTLALDGQLGLAPLAADLRVDARGVDLVTVQAYLNDLSNLRLQSVALDAKGRLRVQSDAAGAVSARYEGSLGLSDVAARDRVAGDEVFHWKRLALNGVDASSAPPAARVDEVTLDDFYARVIVREDGHLNLQDIVRQGGDTQSLTDATPAAAPPKAASATMTTPAPAVAARPPIRIGTVRLQRGTVLFTDNYVKPHYTATLDRLVGTVAGLSSDPRTTATVDLRGEVSGAPLAIAGRVNPLAGALVLDLKGSVKGMELAPLSTYAEKYAGYGIEKGKMSFDVSYRVGDRKLEAQNRLVLDQLTFGKRVENDTATKLPVLLAVALLRDRHGVIDVDLPIGGSLDDPDFSMGGVIVKVIVNLITRAVTAPFSMLGSLFGGGDTLSSIDFQPGSDALTAQAESRLQALATALVERPGLRLDITGAVDAQADAAALREQAAAAERERASRAAPSQNGGTPPARRLGEGNGKTARDPGDADALTDLANRRAQAALRWLAGPGKVPTERLYLTAARDDGGNKVIFDLR